MDVRLDATSVSVGPNPYKASAIVGDPATVWSDGSDATYTETWLSARPTETYGTSASGPLELLTSPSTSVQSISFGIRFSTRNEGNATSGRVAAWLEKPDGSYICSLDGGSGAGGADLNYRDTTVPSPLTLVHTLDGNDYSGTNMGTVAARLVSGAVMRIGRYSPYSNPPPPADYEITVHEAWIQVQVPDPLPPAWAFVALDDDGNFLEGRANTLLIPNSGSAYYGARNYPAQLSYDGAFLWRNLTYGDGFDRYNLTTGVWEATSVIRSADNSHVINQFAGYDTVNDLAVYVRNRAWSAAEQWGFVEVRPHDSGTWINPVPNGITDISYTVGPATATYDPTVAGSGATQYSTQQEVDAGYQFRVQDGYIYYGGALASQRHGHNADGSPYGEAVGLYRMDLSNGATELVYEIPYGLYDQVGGPSDYNNYWFDNLYGGFGALVIIPDPPAPAIEYVDDGVQRIFS